MDRGLCAWTLIELFGHEAALADNVIPVDSCQFPTVIHCPEVAKSSLATRLAPWAKVPSEQTAKSTQL